MARDEEHQRVPGREYESADLSTLLASYVLLFGLMGKLFYSYPDFTWIHSLITEGVFEDIPIVDSTSEMCSGQDMLLQWSKESGSGFSTDMFEDIEADYVRLFISGNKSVLAPPWESVFVNADPTLFQHSTMSVRYWYRRFGLEIENLHHEPDDHIGLECAFISHLFAIALTHANTPNEAILHETINEITQFTTQHVFIWAPHWCDLVIENSRTKLYRGAGWFTKGILISLADFLNVDIDIKVYR